MKNLVFIFLCVTCTISNIFAQQENQSKTSIELAFFNENFGLLGLTKDTPLHLGGSVAIGFLKKQNGVYRGSNSFELGYFKHHTLFQTAYLAWKPKYEWQFQNGINLQSNLGLGYAHTLPTEQTYIAENGAYAAANNNGKPGGMAAFGLGIGYQFNQQSEAPTTVFLRHELTIIAPFNIYKDLPAGVNSMLKIGVVFQPF